MRRGTFIGLGIALLVAILLYVSVELKLAKTLEEARACKYFEANSINRNGTCEVTVSVCNPTNRTIYVEVDVEAAYVEYVSTSKDQWFSLKPYSREFVNVYFKPINYKSLVKLNLQAVSEGKLEFSKSIVVNNKCVVVSSK